MIDHREINEIESLEANGLEKNVSFEKSGIVTQN